MKRYTHHNLQRQLQSVKRHCPQQLVVLGRPTQVPRQDAVENLVVAMVPPS
jgi:hypothetical protein